MIPCAPPWAWITSSWATSSACTASWPTILYFPGGFLADKFSAKKLLSFSLISSGALGLYFATFPSYAMLLFIFAAWGVTTILTFWAASMKVIRMLGDKSEQGKLFGFNEGLSGIARRGGLLCGIVPL